MNSKKVISSFINPNFVPVIIFTILPPWIFGLIVLLCGTLPTYFRARKNIAKLESRGELDKAAAELMSTNNKRYIKGNVVFTENYVFCKNTGYIFTYDEILWAYKHQETTTFLFIPIQVVSSLYLATKDTKPTMVASMGKDKYDEIKNSIIEIYSHNNSCLIGYTNETIAKYKALRK